MAWVGKGGIQSLHVPGTIGSCGIKRFCATLPCGAWILAFAIRLLLYEGLLVGPTDPCVFIEGNEAVLLLAAIGHYCIGGPALRPVGSYVMFVHFV